MHQFTFRDMTDEILAKSMAKLNKGLDKQVAKGKMDEDTKAAILANISTTTELAPAADADLVLEAIVENVEIIKVVNIEKSIDTHYRITIKGIYDAKNWFIVKMTEWYNQPVGIRLLINDIETCFDANKYTERAVATGLKSIERFIELLPPISLECVTLFTKIRIPYISSIQNRAFSEKIALGTFCDFVCAAPIGYELDCDTITFPIQAATFTVVVNDHIPVNVSISGTFDASVLVEILGSSYLLDFSQELSESIVHNQKEYRIFDFLNLVREQHMSLTGSDPKPLMMILPH